MSGGGGAPAPGPERAPAAPASRPATPAGLLAVDRLFAAYLAVTGALAILSLRPAGIAAGVGHGLAVAAIRRWGGRPLPPGRWARFARAVYPVALTPLLYTELAFLNQLLTEGYLDAIVQGWEQALFGAQVSVEAARRLGWFWLSEFLHVGYFTYYAIVPVALFGTFATRGPGGVHAVAFQTALAFFGCYVVFVLVPVAGPRYLFAPIGGVLAEGTAFGLVHAVLEGGSSKGTAFPSSHIAASWAAVLACRRADRRWFWLLALPAAALAIGTVYGRFHYAVDAAAGALVALGVHAAAPALLRRWGAWPAEGGPRPPGERRGDAAEPGASAGGPGGHPGNPAGGPAVQPLA